MGNIVDGIAQAALESRQQPAVMELAKRCREIIRHAERDGVDIDDGNVVDLCADNLPASLADIRTALVVAGLADRFPRATASVPELPNWLLATHD